MKTLSEKGPTHTQPPYHEKTANLYSSPLLAVQADNDVYVIPNKSIFEIIDDNQMGFEHGSLE